MKHLKSLMFGLLIAAGIASAQAQIGYQICLLNTATGEPRANEKVNVTVTLTNNEGGVIYTGNQSATTNDFGVLSLTIGDANTFKDVDLSKLPFWIEMSANGVMIGKSQVLSVPVAEVAKRVAPAITKEKLCSTVWSLGDFGGQKWDISFNLSGRFKLTYSYQSYENGGHVWKEKVQNGSYEIEGNSIWLFRDEYQDCLILKMLNGKLYMVLLDDA